MQNNNYCNGMSSNCKECSIEDIGLIIAAANNILEAQRLTRVFFDSFSSNSNCCCNTEVVDVIVERIDRALEDIQEFIVRFDPDCFECISCFTFIDIQEAKNILRNIRLEICLISKVKLDKCILLDADERIRRVDFTRALAYLARLIKSYCSY